MDHLKTKKVKIFYSKADVISRSPLIQSARKHYIHSKRSGGFWVSVRDLSQAEIIANDTVNIKINIEIRIGYNKKIIDLDYKKLFIEFKGNIYKLVNEIDQYFYDNNDLTLKCKMINDPPTFEGADEYE